MIKKIYIDTRFRTDSSSNSSDFKISLPETVYLPDNTKFFIDDVSIPHSWYSVEKDINDKLYMEVVGDGVLFDIIVPIRPKNYTGSTLATAIQNELNVLIFNGNTDLFTVTYDQELNTIKIEISNDYTFGLLHASELKTKRNGMWKGPDFDSNKPNDMNTQVFKLYEPILANDKDKPFVSPSIDLQPIKNIYLYSPNIGSYNTIGPRGERSILKRYQ